MIIRAANPIDIPAILAIERESLETVHWSREKYCEIVNDKSRFILVAEHESILLGFGVLRFAGQESELENLVVAAGSRRQGVGTVLLKELIRLANHLNATGLFLEVRESNLAARGLYNRCGFVECGRRGRYYRSPEEDAILYRIEPRFSVIPAQAR